MSKGMAVLSLLAIVACSALAGPADAELIVKQNGHFSELVEQLSGKEYVLGSPARDDRPYVDPTPVLHAFRHMAASLAWGDVKVAARKAAELGYEVIEFTDVDTQHEYYVLRENLKAVKTLRGWGSYIVNPQSKVDAIVEVPHPYADMHTPEVGGQIFEECEARGLLLAGAHRDKADVPDLVDSIFHQVHAAWIGPLAQVTAWQIHGFAGQKHKFPAGTQVVASTGDGAIVPEIAALDSAFDEQGMSSYVFTELDADNDDNKQVNGDTPGIAFRSLAAAKNEQGRLSRSLGGAFVHIELEGTVRTNKESRHQASTAIALAMAAAPRGEEADGRRQLASLEVEASPISLAVNHELATPAVEVGAKIVNKAPPAAAPPVVVAAATVEVKPEVRVAAKHAAAVAKPRTAAISAP
ncbi:hypothetical protein [Lacipirellula parvula]|uniref:Uncharacterized protein n=1 Tax=Lacipirellula parvula TaxID=2650471 RepID=A0A5K7X3P6_9BACT|nr:hypothetical protein [Lacipirellula parvula]BBO30442.1 hypothetical protein PLANPX_0054 [Lacipirellula parvula]